MTDFTYEDGNWSEEKWKQLLDMLISSKILTWKEVTSLTLGHLNPSQVGTSLASSKGFKRRYGKGNTMRVVMSWFYEQIGTCADCKTRLELQADHNVPRESYNDPLDADFIENMVLRCRRCNVIKRPSHEFGGNTHLTAESALMWLLFHFRPRTIKDFIRMCRLYGMTMADIRMQEGWAMAHWLQHVQSINYELDDLSQPSKILHWSDGAITRSWSCDKILGEYEVLFDGIGSDAHIAFVASNKKDESGTMRMTFYRFPVKEIPFSHYFMQTNQPPQTLAIHYSAPKRGDSSNEPLLSPLPPRNMTLHAIQCIPADADVRITYNGRSESLNQSKKRKVADYLPSGLGELRVEIHNDSS